MVGLTGVVLVIIFLVYIGLVGLYYYTMPDTEPFAVYESEEEFEEIVRPHVVEPHTWKRDLESESRPTGKKTKDYDLWDSTPE